MKTCLQPLVAILAPLWLAAVGCAPQVQPIPRYDLTMSGTQFLGQPAGGALARPWSSPSDGVSYWEGDGVSGSPRIQINLTEQLAYFYKGGKLVGVSAVSTGREGYRTSAGTFSISQKNRHHRSNLYGDYVDSNGNVVKAEVDVRRDSRPPGSRFRGASMPYFMRFDGGIGMHAGYLPGYAASHGCVRLPEHMAAHFFRNVSNGTPVSVVH